MAEVMSNNHREQQHFYSSLNPNAPAFIPMSYYQKVEDYSTEWWELVQSSPWFRDFWIRECRLEEEEYIAGQFEDAESDDSFGLPDDLDDFFDDFIQKQEEENKERRLITQAMAAGDQWNKSPRGLIESSKQKFEKVPKIVKNVRVAPRKINQPR